MAGEEPSEECREFVQGLVPLEEAQQQREDAPPGAFEGLWDSIAGRRGRGFHFSFFSGAVLLSVAAGLAALMPSRAEGGFWRVGRGVATDLLAAGNDVALPLALGAVALALLAGVAAARGGELSRGVLIVQPFVGGAGAAGVGVLWVGVVLFAILNVIVALLILALYVLGTILIVGMFFGLLAGLFSE